MEINEGNLQALAGYLQKTLSPDPVERRGGNTMLHTLLESNLVLRKLIEQSRYLGI
jgi:hypothetical protein